MATIGITNQHKGMYFVKNLLCIFLVILSSASSAAPKSKGSIKSESLICNKLAQEYENSSKRLAKDDVRSTLTPTSTSFASTILAEASMTLELLKANKCVLPTAAPSSSRYFLPALSCENAVLGRQADEAWSSLNGKTVSQEPLKECDQSQWKTDSGE